MLFFTPIELDYVEDTKGYIKAYFSDSKTITAGLEFFEQLTSAAPTQRYNLKVSDEIRKADSILLYVAGTGHEGFKGEFHVKGSKVDKEFKNYNGKEYFVRLYPTEELTDDVYIETNVDDIALVRIKVYALPKIFPLEEDSLLYHGDYIEAGKVNCYSSTRFLNGANLILESDLTDLTIYVNPSSLPERLEDFAYIFNRDDVIVHPAEISTSTITIPIYEAKLVYICVETSVRPQSYALDVAELDPLIFQRGQNVKFYLKKDTVMKGLYTELTRTTKPIKVTVESLKGCSKVMIKIRKSYYYNYLMNVNESNGINPFDSEKDTDTIIINVGSTGRKVIETIEYPNIDTRCTGADVYSECPTIFYAQSCDDESVVRIGLENNDDPVYILGDAAFVSLPPNSQKTYVVPDVPPLIDTLRIMVNVKKQMKPNIKATITIKTEIETKKTIEITGDREETITNFTNKEDFGTNFYIIVKSRIEISLRLFVKMFATINGTEVDIYNIRGGSAGQVMTLNIVNNTYQIGYFSFYAKNDPDTITAILPNPSATLESVMLHANTKGWSIGESDELSGPILRLPRAGEFYYISIEGIPSQEDTDSGTLEGIMFPGILESQRYNMLKPGVNYTFDGQRIFKFKVNTGRDYLIRKIGSTVESIYLTIDQKVKIPLNDSYTKKVNPIDPEESDDPVEYVLSLHKQQLIGTSEVTFTVFCHWLRCRYDLTIIESEVLSPKSDL